MLKALGQRVSPGAQPLISLPWVHYLPLLWGVQSSEEGLIQLCS